MNNFENPFPQLGTNSDIDPVGYGDQLDDIKRMITANVGKQPLIINVYGEYGQGKTTILKFLEKKFKGDWANLSVFQKDISKFPDLESDLISYQKTHENDNTQGIFVVLDEMQHIDAEGKLSIEQKRFLDILRRFSDNTIDDIDNKKFVLCIAMHPGTKAFLKEQGHMDVEQRIRSFTLNLQDMDYYMAYMLIKEHFNKINMHFNEYFDESFVYAFYVLLSHIEELKNGSRGRLNGRTYSQLFFNLLEFMRKYGHKLSFDDLKDILLDKYELKLGDVKVSLANKGNYYEIYNNLDNLEEKYIWDWFVFSPRWHFKKEFEKIDEIFIEKLINKKLISNRKCIILTPDDNANLDNELRIELDTFPKERIYLNGEKIMIFLDTADENIFNKLDKFKLNEVYRLNEEQLKSIYNFHPPSMDSDELIKYFEKESSEKVDYFYKSLIQNYNTLSKYKWKFKDAKIVTCQSGIRYSYLNVLYKLLGKIEHRVAIFYYAKDYASVEFEKYFKDIISEIDNSDYDLALLFVCPYYIGELPKDKEKIRKMDNRLFIHNLSRTEMINFLDHNINSIDNQIKESIKLYTQEAVDKGFTMPLTGFMEGIKNDSSKFEAKFLKDIEKSWKIEMAKKSGDESQELSTILKSGVDGNGKLINLAKDSLNEFMELDEYGNILGAKLSKYENNFLDLFGSNEISEDELKVTVNKYFSKYSRFDILKYVTEILKIKSILKVENKKFKIIEPIDYLIDILKVFNSVNINELLRKDQDITIKSSISNLKLLLNDLNDKQISIFERAFYNSEMKRILYKINSIKSDDLELNKKIFKKYKEIEQKLESKMGNIHLSKVNVNYYFDKMVKNSKLNDVYKKNIQFSYVDLNTIKNYIGTLLLNLNQDMDKGLLYVLKDILEIINEYNISEEQYAKLKNKLNTLETSEEFGEINKITNNLDKLFKNLKTDFSPSQLEVILQILIDIDFYIINPLNIQFSKLNTKFNDIKNIRGILESNEVLFSKLNNFERHDIYLDKLQIPNIKFERIDEELKLIERITIYNPEILENYLNFIHENYKQETEIEKIILIETQVKKNENKNLLDYLGYMANLDSIDYIKATIKTTYFEEEKIPENDLKNTISLIKGSEEDLKYVDSNEIINQYLLPNGFLKRLTYLEEYYINGKEIKDKKIAYKLANIKDYSKIEGSSTVYRMEGE